MYRMSERKVGRIVNGVTIERRNSIPCISLRHHDPVEALPMTDLARTSLRSQLNTLAINVLSSTPAQGLPSRLC